MAKTTTQTNAETTVQTTPQEATSAPAAPAEPAQGPQALQVRETPQTGVQGPAKPMGLQPSNMTEAWRFSQAAAASKLFGLSDPNAIFMIVIRASELGIGPATALAGMHVINGKPSMSADLMVAICRQRRDICQYFYCVESTIESATWETWRIGDPAPTRSTFTMEDAERAELTKNPMWRKYPRNMLKKRAAAFLVRDVYSDLLTGLTESDEARDIGPRSEQSSGRPSNGSLDALRARLTNGAATTEVE
jgi:hypothetical protein